MPILNFSVTPAGQNENIQPRFVKIKCNDTLATVTTAGYLNPYIKSQGLNIESSDFVFVTASDGHQIYKPVISAGVITLTVLP